MSSKRRKEGYLMIDNRVNEGVPDDMMRAAGLPAGSGKGLFESATISCSHCQALVVLNQDRTRERGYCRKCDSYLCDGCEALRAMSFECKTFNQTVDEVLEATTKQDVSGSSRVILLS